MASATESGSPGTVGRTPVAVARDATNPFRSESSGRSTQRDLGTVSANAHPSAVFLERLQSPRNVAAEEPGPIRDSGLGRLPARFRHVPESMEVDEDALGRGELHNGSDAAPFT